MPGRLTSLFARQVRASPSPGGEAVEVVEVVEAARPSSAAEPTPHVLQRERRALGRRREIELRDVGGLAVEMVRRDRFNPDLLVSRAQRGARAGAADPRARLAARRRGDRRGASRRGVLQVRRAARPRRPLLLALRPARADDAAGAHVHALRAAAPRRRQLLLVLRQCRRRRGLRARFRARSTRPSCARRPTPRRRRAGCEHAAPRAAACRTGIARRRGLLQPQSSAVRAATPRTSPLQEYCLECGLRLVPLPRRALRPDDRLVAGVARLALGRARRAAPRRTGRRRDRGALAATDDEDGTARRPARASRPTTGAVPTLPTDDHSPRRRLTDPTTTTLPTTSTTGRRRPGRRPPRDPRRRIRDTIISWPAGRTATRSSSGRRRRARAAARPTRRPRTRSTPGSARSGSSTRPTTRA